MNIAGLAAIACLGMVALMCAPMAIGMIRHRLRNSTSTIRSEHERQPAGSPTPAARPDRDDRGTGESSRV